MIFYVIVSTYPSILWTETFLQILFPRLDPDWTTVMLHTNHPLDEPRQQHIPRDTRSVVSLRFDEFHDSLSTLWLCQNSYGKIHHD